MATWIDFIEIEPAPKTNRWEVRTKDNGYRLGVIQWFGRWRRYCFFPDSETFYEEQCLRDIAVFCEIQTKQHKERKKTP